MAIVIEGARNGFSADAEVSRAASQDFDKEGLFCQSYLQNETGCYTVGLYMQGMQPSLFAGARKGYSADAEVDFIAYRDIDE